MKDLILVGKQGSGKGTQGKFLIKEFGFQLFETGAELRKIAQTDSDLGKKVKEITERGDLVPNEVVMEIVHEFLTHVDGTTPVLFDGIPRSEIQRVSLEEELQKSGREFQVLEIKLSTEEALKRLLIRGKCNKCGESFGGETCPVCGSDDISRRTDDNEEAIRNRLKNFDEHTFPLLNIWESQGKLISVEGEGAVEEIFEKIKENLAPC